MIREKIINLIKKSIRELQKEKKLPEFKITKVFVEYPRENYGDYSTNIAMEIAKIIKRNPIAVAENLKSQASKPIFLTRLK